MKWFRRKIQSIIYRLRGDYTLDQLKRLGLHVGSDFKCLQGTILDPAHCWLIDIGDNVTLAPGVHILCHDASTKTFLGYTKIGRVNIGNNVFVGAHSVILPGINIGNDVIIGANSTVTKDIPSGMVCAGSPARIICTLEEYLSKERERMCIAPCYDEEWTLRKKVSYDDRMKQKEDLSKTRIAYID